MPDETFRTHYSDKLDDAQRIQMEEIIRSNIVLSEQLTLRARNLALTLSDDLEAIADPKLREAAEKS